MDIRVGTGIDVHAFSEDRSRPLFLACLQWPGERGLEGHSDADVAAHAACDAIPRFLPRKAEAEKAMGAVVGAPVSVSATTTDRLGFTGRGEGLAAIATALVHRI